MACAMGKPVGRIARGWRYSAQGDAGARKSGPTMKADAPAHHVVEGNELSRASVGLGAAVSQVLCHACAEPLAGAASLEGIDSLDRTPHRFRVHVCSRCVSGRTLPLVPSANLGDLYPSTYASHGLPRNRALKRAAI